MSIKNIFLDAGGIILDEKEHENIRAQIGVEVLQTVNPLYDNKKYWIDVSIAVKNYIPKVYSFIIWKNTKEVKLYNKLLDKYNDLWDKLKTPLTIMENIGRVIEKLSFNYKIGILGQYGTELLNLLEKKELLKYFTFKNTQDQFKITKPDPRYFEQILSKAGVKPTESIMIGDRIDKDIIPAKILEMKTIRVRTGIHKNQKPRYPEEFPDADIQNIKEIPLVVETL